MIYIHRLGTGHLPIVFAIIFVLNLGLTYCIAVWRQDVDSIFPYLSELGSTQPESCVFSFLITICAMLSLIIVSLRCQLVSVMTNDTDPFMEKANNVSSYFGLLGGMAMIAVGSFQESSPLISIHLFSAFTCFACGSVFMLIQSWITIKMSPQYNNVRIGWIRLTIAILSVLFLITTMAFGKAASNKFHSVYPDLPTPRPWNRKYDQPGYDLHIVSSVTEWCVALTHVLFILSFQRDFEKIRFEFQTRIPVDHLDQEYF